MQFQGAADDLAKAETALAELVTSYRDTASKLAAWLEENVFKTTYGDRLICIGYERVEAPQDPEAPCVMRLKYEMTIQIMTRARQSKGATT